MRRLVLHIGDCKTGSTSIQEALRRGEFTGVPMPLHFPADANHIPISRAFDGGDPAPLRDLLNAAGEGITVLSAEHFEFVDPAPLAEAIRRFWPDEITVIAYARPHAEALFARYCENVKIGNLRGDAGQFHGAMLNRRRLFYAERFGRWRSAFGASFVLRPFALSELVQGDVVADFMEHAIGTGARAGEALRRNPVPKVEVLALLRALFDVLGREGESKAARTALGRNLARAMVDIGNLVPVMDRKLAEAVAEAYREDAAETDRVFFGRPILGPALAASVDGAAEAPQSLEVGRYFTPETLAVALAMARTIEPLLAERPGVVSQVLRQNFIKGSPSNARIAERLRVYDDPAD